MTEHVFDTPDSEYVVVSDRLLDHCVCGMRSTDSDNPDNGWVTIIPVAYMLGNAQPELIANNISDGSGKPCRVIKAPLDILSKFEEGIRQIALLDGAELKKLPPDVGEMMKQADWLEMRDGKTLPVKVTIHHE